MKRCVVAYATSTRQYLWALELPDGATIEEALAVARRLAAEEDGAAAIPWDEAAVGVFGQVRRRTDPCADGERIELYRALKLDPRRQRRERLQRARRR